MSLLVALPAASLAGPGQAIDAQAFARTEASIREALVAAGAPGAAVAVVSGDRVIWAQGLGVANTETGAPVTADTLFQIGSATKMFTAAAVLSAAASGAVALDRPVGGYVSGLAPCLAAPTLAQLLSHTGGVIDEPDEYGPQGEEGLAAYARTWTSEYCLLPPGRAFSYSNSGFALAGLALQEADKKPFADVMRARVLAPLGMPRTTFRPTEAMTWPLAVGHRKDKEGNVTVVRPLANDARLWPAGTLYSSANEMARFAMALLNDGVVDGKPALPPGVVAKMRAAAAAIPTTGQRYGQGLFLTGDPAYGHGGTMTGYVASVTILPEAKLGIVVLTNGDNANPAPIENAVTGGGRTASTGDRRVASTRLVALAGRRRLRGHVPQSAPLHRRGRPPGRRAGVEAFRPRLPDAILRAGAVPRRSATRRHRDDRVRARPRRPRRLPADERVGAGPRDPVAMRRCAITRGALAALILALPSLAGAQAGDAIEQALRPFATAGAVVEPIGLTVSGRRIHALEPGIPSVANQRRLVLVGGLDGAVESTRAVLDALTAMTGEATPSSNRRRWQVAAVPCVLPDRCDALDGAAAPATAAASTATAIPAGEGLLRRAGAPRSPLSLALGLDAGARPRDRRSPRRRARVARQRAGRRARAGRRRGGPRRVGRRAGHRRTLGPGAGGGTAGERPAGPGAAAVRTLVEGLRLNGPSPMRRALTDRQARAPLDLARTLAGKYPAAPIMSYIPALSWSGALRVSRLTGDPRYRDRAVAQMQPFLAGEKPAIAEPYLLTSLAGHQALFDLAAAEGNAAAAAAARKAADFILSTTADEIVRFATSWTDDMFMATSILARAAAQTRGCAVCRRRGEVADHLRAAPPARGSAVHPRGERAARLGARQRLCGVRADGGADPPAGVVAGAAAGARHLPPADERPPPAPGA